MRLSDANHDVIVDVLNIELFQSDDVVWSNFYRVLRNIDGLNIGGNANQK